MCLYLGSPFLLAFLAHLPFLWNSAFFRLDSLLVKPPIFLFPATPHSHLNSKPWLYLLSLSVPQTWPHKSLMAFYFIHVEDHLHFGGDTVGFSPNHLSPHRSKKLLKWSSKSKDFASIPSKLLFECVLFSNTWWFYHFFTPQASQVPPSIRRLQS